MFLPLSLFFITRYIGWWTSRGIDVFIDLPSSVSSTIQLNTKAPGRAQVHVSRHWNGHQQTAPSKQLPSLGLFFRLDNIIDLARYYILFIEYWSYQNVGLFSCHKWPANGLAEYKYLDLHLDTTTGGPVRFACRAKERKAICSQQLLNWLPKMG